MIHIRIAFNLKTMTREEEINIAVSRYIEENLISAISSNKDSFIEGAKWSDEHPKSPWISVEDDLPCNHKELISTEYDKETVYVVVIGKDVIADTDCMEYNGKEWVWQKNSFFEPTHWFPIPKLPK